MMITVCTLADERYRDVAAMSFPNKERYARKHGYNFVCASRLLDTSRPASWSKIPLVRNCMQFGEWVFWSDADSFIINHDIRLEVFIDGAHDLIVSSDQNGITAGEFLIRSSIWSSWFLDKVWRSEEYIDHIWWETAAFQHVYRSLDWRDAQRVCILTHGTMTAYNTDWRPGSFIVHFAGLGRDPARLVSMMKEFKNANHVE